jgi:hypothetical protein
MNPLSDRPILAALGLVGVVALVPAVLQACGEKDEGASPPDYDRCPSGMIEISEHKSSGADASPAPPGVYDVTMKDSVQGGVSAFIMREVAGGWATEWSFLEKLSVTEYSVRLQSPRIGVYRVDAYGIFAVDGRNCLGSEYRQFLIANPSPVVDAASDVPALDTDATSSEDADVTPEGADSLDGSDAGEAGPD